jgi:hypothetical protein
MSRLTRRGRRVLAFGVVGVVAVTGAVVVTRITDLPLPPLRESCTATSRDGEVRLSKEQAENAATIAAVGLREGFGERAVTIALATAYQESKIENLPGGDRDSIGLFQQRPSQGWGTPEEIKDPVYSATKFYDALGKVQGFRGMAVTEAAQAVQRSAFPNAYADHEDDAAVLSAALTGRPDADLSCSIRTDDVAAQVAGASGLTPRAATVRKELERAFGERSLGGFAPGGVRTGHISGSAHYDGRALDIFYRPVNAASKRDGWATAHWLVAHADRLGIATVIYDSRIWTARRSAQGWRDYVHPSGDTGNDVLMHRDHVHVDVLRGA